MLCTLLLLFPFLAYAATARVSSFHITTTDGKTRLTLDLDDTIDYNVFMLANPDRLVIDFPGARLATSLQGAFSKSPVRDVRSGHPEPGVLRIVLDMRKSVRHTVSLQAGNGNKATLAIEFYDPDYQPPAIKKEKKTALAVPAVAPATPQSAPATQPSKQAAPADENSQLEQAMLQQVLNKQKPKTAKQQPAQSANADNKTKKSVTPLPIPPETTVTQSSTPLPAPVAAASNQRVINVIIDPGHGGKDPGTTGHFGVREKDVVLAIGLDLYQLLQKDPRFHTVMTRNGDYFLTLRQRLMVARKNHGDVFIAIHADAFKDPFATGAAIYALSPHGASSEAALWLAKKENYSELGGIQLSDKSDLLRSVLIDLSQTATVSSSLKLGQNLLDELGKVGKLHHSTIEQAPFMVLKSPDIPSVLIETGFLSNPSEEERLRNPIYQQQIAQAVYAGILDYFTTNPAAGKLIVNTKK